MVVRTEVLNSIRNTGSTKSCRGNARKLIGLTEVDTLCIRNAGSTDFAEENAGRSMGLAEVDTVCVKDTGRADFTAGNQKVLADVDIQDIEDTSGKNEAHTDKPVNQNHFRQIMGSLMFLMIGSRPDIAAAIGLVSQFAEDPRTSHLQAAKRIIRYLKGSVDLELCLGVEEDDPKNEIKLVGYSDASWGNDLDTRKSTTGYIFYISGGVVSWTSKKQNTVALSTTEAEYMALSHTTKEAIWLRGLLRELGYTQNQATTIFEDNQSCINLAKNPVHHARSKHIDIQHHFIREKIISKEIHLEYTPTEEMIADIFTKPLAGPKFLKFRKDVNLQQKENL